MNYPPTPSTEDCVPTDYTGADCPLDYVPVTNPAPSARTGAPLADTGMQGTGLMWLAAILLIVGICAVAWYQLQKTKESHVNQ